MEAAIHSPKAFPTMNSGARIMTHIHLSFGSAAFSHPSPPWSFRGMVRCCTVHVQRKTVARQLRRMVNVERMLGPVTKVDPSGGTVHSVWKVLL